MSPVFGTALAWIFLGERLTPQELGAMALALGGVTWVVLERGKGAGAQISSRTYAIGILFGLGAALCQATNLVMAKQGLAGGYPALSGTMIRMTFAATVMWAWAAVIGEFGRTIRKVRADGQAATCPVQQNDVAGVDQVRVLDLFPVQAPQLGPAPGGIGIPAGYAPKGVTRHYNVPVGRVFF
jgi:uncharacterized membrane protein